MPDITAAVIGREARRTARLIHIGLDSPVRIWDGAGSFRAPEDDDFDAGSLYRQSSAIQSLPELGRMYDGTSQSIEFRLNATSASVMALYSHAIRGRQVVVGRVFLGGDLQPAAAIGWYWYGTLGAPRLITSASEKMLILTATSGFTNRRAKGLKAWSDAGHQALHSGDKFFSNVARYNVNTSRKWPD